MTHRCITGRLRVNRFVAVFACACAAVVLLSCKTAEKAPLAKTFATPEDAARALIDAAKAGTDDSLLAIFGPEARDLIESDAKTARANRQVFKVAAAEKWQLVDRDGAKTLVIGNEQWPFPVPLVKDASGWRFDTTAGKEEVLNRRIGRNELAAIRVSSMYVTAQRLYAHAGHDGEPAGLYAQAFRSDRGRQNGLYWPAGRGEKRSPVGDLVADAAADAKRPDANSQQPSPFHGYYFRILTAQGADAPGGAKSYIVNGKMSGGFALVAWPAQYDATGVMTFVVNQDGTVRQKDLGPETDAAARAMTSYNPDASWEAVQ